MLVLNITAVPMWGLQAAMISTAVQEEAQGCESTARCLLDKTCDMLFSTLAASGIYHICISNAGAAKP